MVTVMTMIIMMIKVMIHIIMLREFIVSTDP